MKWLLVIATITVRLATANEAIPLLLDKTQEDETTAAVTAALVTEKVFQSVQSIEELDTALKSIPPTKKVVVYFSSTKRCPPCQQLAPYAVRFAEEKKDSYAILYVDTTEVMGASPTPPTETYQKLSKLFYKYMKQGKLPNAAVLNYGEKESPPWVPEPFQLGRAAGLFKNGISPERKTAAVEEESAIRSLAGGDGKLASPDATESLKRILEVGASN